MDNQRRLERRFLALGVLASVLVIGGLGLGLQHLRDNAQREETRSTAVVRNLRELYIRLLDAETGQRGYLLTGDAQEKQNRAAMWAELDRASASFDQLAASFTTQENKEHWDEAKALMVEFRQAQDKAEAVAFTPKAYPATELLTNEAGPLIATMKRSSSRRVPSASTC